MTHTITLSEETYIALSEAAQMRGVTLDAFIASIAQDVLNQRTGKNMDGDAFLRYLGADDDEIAAPIEEDDTPTA
jgi:hypothetical protein